MQYWMMRLFLADRFAGTLFEREGDAPRLAREEYLNAAFREKFVFTHRKKNYVYTPYKNVAPTILAGVVAREHKVAIRREPTAKAEDVADWDTANVFIDTSGEGDGQRIAMQDVAVVGKPLSVFRSIVDYINSRNPESDWYIAVNSITSDHDFWQTVKAYQGKITEITLVFAAPNMWKGDSETEKALKELDHQNGIKETEAKLRNPDGKINPGNPHSDTRLASGVRFATRGGGRIKVKSKKKIIFNSEDHVIKQAPAEDSAIQDTESMVISALAQWLLRQ